MQQDTRPNTDPRRENFLPRWPVPVLPVLWALLVATPALSARVVDLYAGEVEAGTVAGRDQAAAFRLALAQVLVKVTGQRDVATDASLLAEFGDAAELVQQYQTDDEGRLWVRFDATAVRSRLDRLGQPIWAADRPATVVWLAIDTGGGDRRIVAAEPEQVHGIGSAGGSRAERMAADVRADLLAAARRRGLPIVLPLGDSEDLARVSVADVWGEFATPVLAASERYAGDITLIGRARVFGDGTARVRWTAMLRTDRYEWEGGVAAGPEYLADRLAAQMATSIDATRSVRLRVSGLASFDDYGAVSAYLTSLGIIDAAAVEQVAGDSVTYALQVRGTLDQLMRAIALRRLLQPVDDRAPGPGTSSGATDRVELSYRLVAGP